MRTNTLEINLSTRKRDGVDVSELRECQLPISRVTGNLKSTWTVNALIRSYMLRPSLVVPPDAENYDAHHQVEYPTHWGSKPKKLPNGVTAAV